MADFDKNLSNLTPIQKFYVDTKIFLTGGTGFLGILILEKLLTSCPGISKVYILVRNKKGKDVQARMDKFFEDVVFSRLRSQCPNFREKIVVVEGDCELPQLGISDRDKETLIREVNVIFHGAATVRFDEALNRASKINVRAVRDILVLARQMPNLKSFVHISTVYSNCVRKHIKEEIYPPAMDYKNLLQAMEALSDDIVTKITPLLLGEYPNTYSYTKQIGEDVVRQEGGGLPIGIHRPSIVLSTYKQPLEGWINNIYGPTGLMTAAGLGITKTSPCDVNGISNMVPADMVVNSIIASAWDVAEHFTKQIDSNDNVAVYNFEMSRGPDLTWGRYMLTCKKYAYKYFSVKAIWFVDCMPIKSYFAFTIVAFFIHTIPGAIADAVLVCLRKPPMFLKIYRKIHEVEKMVVRFKMTDWIFDSQNVGKLLDRMSEKDKEIFYSDVNDLNWEEYLDSYVLGIRLYLVKDPLETLPAGQKHFRRLYWIHQLTKTVIALFFMWMLWCRFSFGSRTML